MDSFKNRYLLIKDIQNILKAKIFNGQDFLTENILYIYASDLMSDVLAYGKSGSILLTGLNSVQTAISAHMAEFKGIVFLRGKKPDPGIIKFALANELVILSTKDDMYEACVKIAGLTIIDNENFSKEEKNVMNHFFEIDGGDFASAGLVSTEIKSILKSIGYDPLLIRRIAISTYEAEMNIVMHAKSASVSMKESNKEIIIIFNDKGKGIPDIEKAMQQGYSTSTDEQRAMGFGAGMGLPNIKKNTDVLNITSNVGVGTRLEMRFFVK